MGSKVTWSHEEGIWMHQDVASKICRVSMGFDQPEKYNLPNQPSRVALSYQCCNACARMEGECKSFVFKTTTHECFLKSAYVSEENTIDCKDCISYDESSRSYVFQKAAVSVRQLSWNWQDQRTWKMDSFGSAGGWGVARQGGGQVSCRFALGYDQPHDYDIQGPLIVDSAVLCCNACSEMEGTPDHWLDKGDPLL